MHIKTHAHKIIIYNGLCWSIFSVSITILCAIAAQNAVPEATDCVPRQRNAFCPLSVIYIKPRINNTSQTDRNLMRTLNTLPCLQH